MLVLSRRAGEAIQVGPDVRVVLVEIDRNKVRIGIEAPRGVPIFREELLPLDQPADGHCPLCNGSGFPGTTERNCPNCSPAAPAPGH